MTPETTTPGGSAPLDPLIGTGHGLDHILIVVRNLKAASQDFREKLGFVVKPDSQFPSGLENEIIDLHDREYLELLALYNRETGHPDVAEIENFLSKGEGVAGFGIRVSSAEATASYLKAKGFHVKGPNSGTTTYPGIEEKPPPLWRHLQLDSGQKFIDDVLFFSEYLEAAYREFRTRHPQLYDPDAPPPDHRNSALRGLHPWLATARPEEVAAAYEAVGFPILRRAKAGPLKGTAVEVRIGLNSLVIVGSEGPSGPIHDFLRQRDSSYGLIGISLGVRSIASALGAMPPDVAAALAPTEGLFGTSVWVPPHVAHGVWLELFETPMPEGPRP
jgi:catechol 2,3-dioxygenase-like lactoylglutathione lyase family enzyme